MTDSKRMASGHGHGVKMDSSPDDVRIAPDDPEAARAAEDLEAEEEAAEAHAESRLESAREDGELKELP
jgi:hypothetical protein